MQRNLTYGARTFVSSAGATAGTSAVNGTSVDMLGYEGVRFIAILGTLTATQVTSLKLQGSTDNATFVDLAGTSVGPAADGDGGKTLICEIFRPQHRYIRPVLGRGTANAVLQAILAEQFLSRFEPVAADATVSAQKVLDYTAAGTA